MLQISKGSFSTLIKLLEARISALALEYLAFGSDAVKSDVAESVRNLLTTFRVTNVLKEDFFPDLVDFCDSKVSDVFSGDITPSDFISSVHIFTVTNLVCQGVL